MAASSRGVTRKKVKSAGRGQVEAAGRSVATLWAVALATRQVHQGEPEQAVDVHDAQAAAVIRSAWAMVHRVCAHIGWQRAMDLRPRVAVLGALCGRRRGRVCVSVRGWGHVLMTQPAPVTGGLEGREDPGASGRVEGAWEAPPQRPPGSAVSVAGPRTPGPFPRPLTSRGESPGRFLVVHLQSSPTVAANDITRPSWPGSQPGPRSPPCHVQAMGSTIMGRR